LNAGVGPNYLFDIYEFRIKIGSPLALRTIFLPLKTYTWATQAGLC